MKVRVITRPGARVDKIEEVEKDFFRISVREPAEDGQANEAVIRLLAGHYGLPVDRFTLLSGQKSRDKTIGFQP